MICEWSSAEYVSSCPTVFASSIFFLAVCLGQVLMVATGTSLYRKSGPVSHFELSSWETEIGLVPISAGLSFVAILDHCDGLESVHILSLLDVTYRSKEPVSLFIQANTTSLSEK